MATCPYRPEPCPISAGHYDAPNMNAGKQPIWHCAQCLEWEARNEGDQTPPPRITPS